eukprot:4828693-Alexandrium_andersonii.AAC.1
MPGVCFDGGPNQALMVCCHRSIARPLTTCLAMLDGGRGQARVCTATDSWPTAKSCHRPEAGQDSNLSIRARVVGR